MKNLILFLSLFLLINVVYSQSSKTLVKTFEFDVNKILIDIPGTVKINYWGSSTIKVSLTVSTNTIPDNLNSLIKVNRYNLVTSNENSTLTIKFIKPLSELIITNRKLIETFEIELWIPKNIELINYSDFK